MIKNENALLQFQRSLSQFLIYIERIAELLPTQVIGIKDTNSKYVYCSANYAQLLGYPVAEIIGKSGMFINDQNTALRVKEDQEIMLQKRTQAFLHIDKLAGKLTPLTFIKSPIIEPITQQAIGLLCQVFEFSTIDPTKQLLQSYKQLQLKPSKPGQCPKLSKREKQVIFLFLANLNSQEITEVLFAMEGKRVSKSTIDCLFTDQLFPKFAVFNRQALYDKLVQLGYNKLIPLEMLDKPTFQLDQQQIY